ncbi:hypothetical protein QF042_003557 [Pedobacter sp. W3I1]|uniref:hypothetical protein n=1 Tax=Pedobacter sp. W3I1 TaxID=3042291 RepID=UPI00278A63FC|nr:hypothetical protein [Pedobacter sp. W3I1]MDQ0639992.1 hypothetical protein [Pedobacter sp. W3I1]
MKNKIRNNSTRLCQMPIYISLLLMVMSCNGQENPGYIGAKYGVLDLDKITFSEQLDTLFSKTEKYYKLPKGEEVFDEKLGKYVMADTLYHIYRIPAKNVAEGTFSFKRLEVKPKEVVDFYADHSHRFRKVEVSVYMSDGQYRQLRDDCKNFKDITPANVKKVNNGKYIILQSNDTQKQILTTLYCLDNRLENNGDLNQNYFVRIAKTSLKIKNDEFDKQLNDEIYIPL